MDQNPIANFGEPPNVSVKVGCEVFHCHRCILTLHSKYFESLFGGYFKEANDSSCTVCLPSEYADEKSFSKLLYAMYDEPLKIEDDLPSLLITCSYLHLSRLTDECKQHIIQNLKTIDLPKLIVLPQLKEYASLYATIMKYVCRHFSEMYPKMIRIPFDLLEELLKHEELLIFSRDHALKFCKLWLGHYRCKRKYYRKRISHLLLPFRNYRKSNVVNQCTRYMNNNFSTKDMVELLLTFQSRENQPLYSAVKGHICQNFCKVPMNELVKISFPVFEDLFSSLELFDLHTCAEYVLSFSLEWIDYCKTDRKTYQQRISYLIRPFLAHHIISTNSYCYSNSDDSNSDYSYDYSYYSSSDDYNFIYDWNYNSESSDDSYY